MKQVTIYDTEHFTLISYGGGLAYSLTSKRYNRNIYVQGDDATWFRDSWEAIDESTPPPTSIDQVLYRLRDVYSDISETAQAI